MAAFKPAGLQEDNSETVREANSRTLATDKSAWANAAARSFADKTRPVAEVAAAVLESALLSICPLLGQKAKGMNAAPPQQKNASVRDGLVY